MAKYIKTEEGYKRLEDVDGMIPVVDEGSAVLVDNLTYEDYDNGNYPKCTFIVGEKYDVIINDITYENLTCYLDGECRVIGSNDECPYYIDDDGGNDLYIDSDIETITIIQQSVKKFYESYLPDTIARIDDVETIIDSKMDKENPVGTGSFSMNRKADTTIGDYSHAEGFDTIASGKASHAEGYYTIASGKASHAEGIDTSASGDYSHAEGYNTMALGGYSHAEGASSIASGEHSHAQGINTVSFTKCQSVSGKYNISEGLVQGIALASTLPYKVYIPTSNILLASSYIYDSKTGVYTLRSPVSIDIDTLQSNLSFYVGYYFIITKNINKDEIKSIGKNGYGTTMGMFRSEPNIFDDMYGFCVIDSDISIGEYWDSDILQQNSGKYAHIVGNGTSDTSRSNAHTLDWNGNAWYQGEVYVGGTSQDDEEAKRLVAVDELTSYSEFVTEYKEYYFNLAQHRKTDAELAEQLKNNIEECTFHYNLNGTDFPFVVYSVETYDSTAGRYTSITLRRESGGSESNYITVHESNLVDMDNINYTSNNVTITAPHKVEVIHKLNEKYLPDGVMFTPATAQVGQTIVVSEVDENGKPTKWESATPVTAQFVIWEATD